MTSFDGILRVANDVLTRNRAFVDSLDWLLLNRDLNGRLRLIAPDAVRGDAGQRQQMDALYAALAQGISPHGYPDGAGVLFEPRRDEACQGAALFPLDEFRNVWLVDRLVTESNWASIAPEAKLPMAPRVVFFSIKGGVGRSSALAACAWSLAQAGKRVLVLDLDLESPGLSSSLLPESRQPQYGITDWLVEDLVDNGDVVLESMVATSALSHDGEILVVPAHGKDPGEYIAKLGRVWMPKVGEDGTRESWSGRLARLLQTLEARIRPDVILIDSRAGIDEVASSCVTDLGANLVLLFALEGSQTWSGFRILFEHWRRAKVAETIRERLKIVAALVPDLQGVDYIADLREHAYEVFAASLYDEIKPADEGAIGPTSVDAKWQVRQVVEGWNFDEADEGAPHYPWPVSWHRSFVGLRSLHGRFADIDAQQVAYVFGELIDGVKGVVEGRMQHD
jgi:hypothetical protein